MGKFVVIEDGERPTGEADEDRQISAEFIRYLALGGCDALPGKVPENGIKVQGARITDTLDIQGAKLEQDLRLENCYFDHAPIAYDAQVKNLNFKGSDLPGLEAGGLQADASVTLRRTRVSGIIGLIGAKIGADLSLTDADVTTSDVGLECDRAQINGTVNLVDLKSKGQLRLIAASVGGSLDCTGATLTSGDKNDSALSCDRLSVGGDFFLVETHVYGSLRMVGAQIGGNLDCEAIRMFGEKTEFLADNAQVAGAFLLRPFTDPKTDEITAPVEIPGTLDLTAAKFGHINDHTEAWPKPGKGKLRLDRLTYDAFVNSPVSANDRIAWLDLQQEEPGEFAPHPWVHCAKVLRDLGHSEAARRVLIAKESRQRRQRRIKQWAESQCIAWFGRTIWDRFLAVTIRYGHRPILALAWLVVLSIAGFVAIDKAYHAGYVHPTASAVTGHARWEACGPAHGEPNSIRAQDQTRIQCFDAPDDIADSPPFPAAMYAVDTVIPVISFGVQGDWKVVSAPGQGHWRFIDWVLILFGWVFSGLAVAGFSGLVKSD